MYISIYAYLRMCASCDAQVFFRMYCRTSLIDYIYRYEYIYVYIYIYTYIYAYTCMYVYIYRVVRAVQLTSSFACTARPP